jgi:hypothetical protein
MSENAILLSGDVMIDIATAAGASTGFQLLEADVFKITPKSETKNVISRGRTKYGQAVATVVLPGITEFELQLTEITRQVLATMLAGTITDTTQVVGAITPTVTAVLGRWVEIGSRNITISAVKNATADTTYKLGTDYQINERLGLLYAIDGGAITDGEILDLTGNTKAVTGSRITGAQQYRYQLKIRLDGQNLNTGENVTFAADAAVVTPSDAQDFLQDKFMAAALKGTLNIPDGGSAPYTLDVID